MIIDYRAKLMQLLSEIENEAQSMERDLKEQELYNVALLAEFSDKDWREYQKRLAFVPRGRLQ